MLCYGRSTDALPMPRRAAPRRWVVLRIFALVRRYCERLIATIRRAAKPIHFSPKIVDLMYPSLCFISFHIVPRGMAWRGCVETSLELEPIVFAHIPMNPDDFFWLLQTSILCEICKSWFLWDQVWKFTICLVLILQNYQLNTESIVNIDCIN